MNDSKRKSGAAPQESTGRTSSETSASERHEPAATARDIRVELTRAAEKDLRDIGNRKHLGQIARKLDALSVDPKPHDARPLQGEAYRANGWNFFRVDVGEYRIVYDLDESGELLTIVTITVIGRRNDDAVYRLLGRRHG
ncbi:type II toxin-antitoxin system RelE family toxin [Deinococcus planocerae]|uniref:type II toxin-antitoxin system RelE family toxin n=1 Tax=Deinococcus planocerae TaxID=1737569 RepID=UPI0015E1414E|nr:type II toxin-antitoxin system RelE/ParE family toxin [Deinococcus planocerae]